MLDSAGIVGQPRVASDVSQFASELVPCAEDAFAFEAGLFGDAEGALVAGKDPQLEPGEIVEGRERPVAQ